MAVDGPGHGLRLGLLDETREFTGGGEAAEIRERGGAMEHEEHQPNAGPAQHLDSDPPPLSYAPPNGIGQTQGYKVSHVMVSQPSPGLSADSDLEYISSDDVPPLRPASPNEVDQAYR